MGVRRFLSCPGLAVGLLPTGRGFQVVVFRSESGSGGRTGRLEPTLLFGRWWLGPLLPPLSARCPPGCLGQGVPALALMLVLRAGLRWSATLDGLTARSCSLLRRRARHRMCTSALSVGPMKLIPIGASGTAMEYVRGLRSLR